MISFAVTAPAGELSLWHLIIQASWVVKLVMFGLASASVWCWALGWAWPVLPGAMRC